jgi:ribose 5-phosphate isomerase B
MSGRDAIFIASDHAGFSLKAAIIKSMPQFEWIDLGPPSAERVDYPDFAEKLSLKVAALPTGRGVLICGSGIGMSIAANKMPGIRAALCENPVSSKLSREHNDANVLCLGSRFVAPEYACDIVKSFLDSPFSNDARHLVRVEKMMNLEKK